jgi:hypothetical protein
VWQGVVDANHWHCREGKGYQEVHLDLNHNSFDPDLWYYLNMKRKKDWLLISTVFGYTVVCAALIVMVAPYSDAYLNGLKGFFGTFTWLINYLTGG